MDAAQTYVERAPVPALSGHVRTVWIQRTGQEPYLQRNLPTGGFELHCPIGSVPWLVGPLSVATVQVLPARTTLVGARFHPGAALPLLARPASELLDVTVRLDHVWGGAAARLGERLAGTPDPDEALDLLQRHLVTRLALRDHADPLVSEAIRRLGPWGTPGIGRLASDLAVSPSQLRRRCLAAVGVSPKTLQRTLRFQGYLALVQATSAAEGLPRGGRQADLAAEAGYADHAHLSRECLRLTGLTPRELLGNRVDRCGCGHDHAASYLPVLAART